MFRWPARIALCLSWSALALLAGPLTRPYSVDNYDVSIRTDLAKQRLYGEAEIRFHGVGDTAASALELDGGGLQVTGVFEGQAPQSFEQNRGMLFVVLTNPVHPDEQRTIKVQYQAGPAAGLKFFSDQIVASAVGDWMPCNNSPGERAMLHLTLAAPADARIAASGQLTATRASEGATVTEWRIDSPTEPSRFGFALGTFAENASDAEGVRLRVLGAGPEVLDPTAAAIHDLASRTGRSYPGKTYTQVFTHSDAVCSLAELTLLPESYAQGLDKQPDNLWILADELAHQWFGIGIAAKNSSALWLSEGIPAFLADAFLGQRLGKDEFEREIERTRQTYFRLRSEGGDRPLADSTGGEISTYKGAWFLYLVDQLMGDGPFWNGLKLYTSNEWGRAAASEDLQRALDAVNTGSGNGDRKGAAHKNNSKALDNLFDVWVYGISDSKTKKGK